MIGVFTVTILMSGCSTHQLNTKSPDPIASLGKDIKVTVTGGTSGISDQLSRHIQANLLTEGFNIVSDEKATNLNVVITEFNAGNAALRLTIGFGAGRGSLVYNAKYLKAGKILADYTGEERFTGMELKPGTKFRVAGQFSGEEEATQILLEDASKNIVDLATKTKL